MNYTYGFFNEDGSEFTITDPRTPRAFDNFLWNDAIYSNAQQTGVGYCDYQIDGTEGIQLYTGIGRICDFDVFGRDHLMSRLIYVRDNATGEYWNANWEPVCRDYESFACTHGMGYTQIKSKTNGIESGFRIFVPKGNDPVELWTLRIKNESNTPRSLSLFTYNQIQFSYKWGFDSYGDMIYRNSLFYPELNAIVASKHPFRKPHPYLTAFMGADHPVAAFDGSRDAFVGTYSTLAAPRAVIEGQCSNTPGSADATIGALQFDITLQPSEEKVISVVIGATDSVQNVPQLKDKYLGHIDEFFAELKADKQQLSQHNRIKTPDSHFDRILNHWVKQATLFGATWCRWGYNGFRDIVQQGLGVASCDPQRARRILVAAFTHQYSHGMAIRGWNPIDEKPYSDSALWLVFTLVAYLKESGDFALLDEVVPFYDEGSATVLDHIQRALDFLENNKGAHDLCLIKFGDWNDSLTGVGKEGRGESVWLSQAYAEAMRQMAALMDHVKNDVKKADYLARRERIIKAINANAWDGGWYTRCYDDSGSAIGSKDNPFAKIFMEPQCWGLIAGVADDERARQLLASCDELLATEVGYLLLTPSFKEFDPNIGRISSMEPGICENGTIYAHLNIWMILGLLRYGMGDKAYDIFRRITPGYVDGEASLKQKCPPFQYSNCYFGPEHRNNKFQQEFTWITGSVAWFNIVPVTEMLGAKADFDGLVIDPCLPSQWNECEVERSYRGATYHISIKNPNGLQKGAVTLTLDGKPVDGNKLPLPQSGGTHKVEVLIS